MTPRAVSLRGGLHAELAHLVEADAPATLAYFDRVSRETDFLGFGADEYPRGLEEEAQSWRAFADPATGGEIASYARESSYGRIALAPTGEMYASFQVRADIGLYSSDNGHEIKTLNHPGVYDVAFSPDGKFFATSQGLAGRSDVRVLALLAE